MSSNGGVPVENKMGVMPVGRLLMTMSLPMIFSMLVQALYNVVDSMFVARLSEEALTAVSLVFPVQNLMIGVATGTGVGVNALLSKSLGEKSHDTANRTAVNSLFLAGLSFVAFAVFGTALAGLFFSTQTGNPEIALDGVAYMRIVSIGSFSLFSQIAFEKLLQSTGKTLYSMVVQCLGAITNIILDPIMIFGLLGFPAMGVAGAALATVIGQTVAAVAAVFVNRRVNNEIQLTFRGFRPDGGIIRRIYAVGVPSIIMASIGSVMTYGINKILIAFTATATAVFGAYFKLQSFIFMPVFGINNGMVPVISYNYGARRPQRIVEAIRFSVISAVVIMLAGLVVFWAFPGQLLAIFNASPEMLAIGIPALRIISLSFVFAGYCIITLSVCQALGHGFVGLLVSAIRQLVIILPVAYLLSRIGGLSLIWWAYPFAEIFTVLLCIYFQRRLYIREIKPLWDTAVSGR